MSESPITLGSNIEPPVVCMETCQDIYAILKSDEFSPAKHNAALFALVTYLQKHKAEFQDKDWPWAEELGGKSQ